MSSFFRSAGEVTDSQDETSGSLASELAEEQDGGGHHGAPASQFHDSNNLSRTWTIDSVSSGRTTELAQEVATLNSTDANDMLVQALLEEKCLREALDNFTDLHGNPTVYTKDHPDVQALAAEKYKFMTSTLGNLNVMRATSGPATPDGLAKKQQFRQGLDVLSSRSPHPGRPALASRSASMLQMSDAMRSLTVSEPRRIKSPPSGLAPVYEQFSRSVDSVSTLPPLLHPLIDHPMFEMSRYLRDFKEIKMIGKGGYGRVYHVEHRLDGASYAVKKITLNAARVKRIKDRGQVELDALLNELRMLARFDHPNIVRYFGGWLEHSTPSLSVEQGSNGRLLLEGPDANTGPGAEMSDDNFNPFSGHSIPREPSTNGVDIMFETSDGGGEVLADMDDLDDDDELYKELKPQLVNSPVAPLVRRASESTTISARSKLSSIRSVGENIVEDDEEVLPVPITDTSDGLCMSFESTHDDDPPRDAGPALTLHIQMSLHPISLADYLDIHSGSSAEDSMQNVRHCFHLKPSIFILLAILDGVEYLHECGVVHRDLKPSNVFLSVHSSRSSASVDVSTCEECRREGTTEPRFLSVRLGDFGLVTAIARVEPQISAGSHKAVGTELYRPVDPPTSINEKLDVYALGVIATELLRPFSTRMQRQHDLQDVRYDRVDANFFVAFGPRAEELTTCVKEMTCRDAGARLTCTQVRSRLEKLAT